MASRSAWLARWVSRVLHPFVVLPLAVLLALGRRATGQALASAGAVALLLLLPLLALIVWQVRAGGWSDHDVSDRGHRKGLYRGALLVLPLGTMLAAWQLPQLRAELLAGWLLLLVSMLADRWLKTSLHLAFGSFAALLAASDLARAAGCGAALLLLAWSRLTLRRHTLAEVATGAGLGAVVGGLLRFGVLTQLLPAGSAPPTLEPWSGIALVRIPAGEFVMGSPPGEPLREAQEGRHPVQLTRAFLLGRTEVTQAQWERVMGTRPSHFATCGPDCPVENVNYLEVELFLQRLNARAGGGFRLPSEAEWEYACRAGSTGAYASGDTLTRQQANFGGTGPLPVGSFPANAWGLADMHGNVWEWCADWHCPYGDGPAVDPVGRCASDKRVIRGGSWAFEADSARCALRYTHRPVDRGPSLGFRVARDVVE